MMALLLLAGSVVGFEAEKRYHQMGLDVPALPLQIGGVANFEMENTSCTVLLNQNLCVRKSFKDL